MTSIIINQGYSVALRKESVDRNIQDKNTSKDEKMSLSVRRAWIEIIQKIAHLCLKPSLSVRRAWIEMFLSTPPRKAETSLSVRRAWIEIEEVPTNEEQTERRSP